MSQYLINRVLKLAEGQSLASAVATGGVKLNNYQSAKVIIDASSIADETTVARVFAILPDKTEVEVKTKTLDFTNETQFEIDIVANEIAHYDATAFKIVVDEIESTENEVTITTLLGDPRYTNDEGSQLVEIEETDEEEPEENDDEEPGGEIL